MVKPVALGTTNSMPSLHVPQRDATLPSNRALELSSLWIRPAVRFCLALFSSFTDDFEFYFAHWTTSSAPLVRLLDLPIAWFVLLTGIFGVLFIQRSPRSAWIWLALLVTIQGVCIHNMLEVTGGGPIYSDDHPSFMFRVWEFTASFPQQVNYNPYWNGGVVAHMGMSSGITAIALLFWPLWQIAEPQTIYTAVFLIMYVVCIPWIVVGSMYLIRAPRNAAFIAGILSLGVCGYYFKWLLHYGTVGANFSIPFIIPVMACLYRVIYLGKRERWLGPLLVLCVLILFAWPPCAIVMAALIPSLLIASRRFTWKMVFFFSLCAIAFIALYWKHLYLILFSSETFNKHLVGVVASSGAKEQFALDMETFMAGVHHLFRRLRDGHPLILFLGLGGAAFYPSKTIRRWYLPTVLTLILVVGWGRYYFPDLQLRRMYMPLMFTALIPTALWCSRLLASRGARLCLLRGALVSMLILGGWNVTQVYAKKGSSPYNVLSPEMHDLVGWIKRHTPDDGRILFAGRTVHKFGRAHVAALPLLTKREMMACDYYAFSPKAVEYEYPPRVFRTAPDGTHASCSCTTYRM